jgi:hypothetical protein
MTIDRADELQGKHTLFGRCVGDTIYSACFIGMRYDTAVDTRKSDAMKIGAMGM